MDITVLSPGLEDCVKSHFQIMGEMIPGSEDMIRFGCFILSTTSVLKVGDIHYLKTGLLNPYKHGPIYEHEDCTACMFLGQFTIYANGRNEYTTYDLYYHDGDLEETVIARYGNDGPDYSSGLDSKTIPLRAAQDRAKRFGLIEQCQEQQKQEVG